MSEITTPTLGQHRLKVALRQPQIAPNTGNVARLCVATGTQLHLVRPLGFVLSDRQLKRSAMDYWPRLDLVMHDDDEAFFERQRASGGRLWVMTSKGGRSMWDVQFGAHDTLLFGNEGSGLPEGIMRARADRCVRIPQVEGERCLNLATAVGIAVYEALRQVAKTRA